MRFFGRNQYAPIRDLGELKSSDDGDELSEHDGKIRKPPIVPFNLWLMMVLSVLIAANIVVFFHLKFGSKHFNEDIKLVSSYCEYYHLKNKQKRHSISW
jgi:hypothetical protein